MDYLDLYAQDAGTAGATTVDNSGLGATASERANMPSAAARKKKRRPARTSSMPANKPAVDANSHPMSMSGTTPSS